MVANKREGQGNIDWDVSILRKFSKFSIINTFDKKENKTKKNIVNWFNFKTAAYVTMFSVLCVAIVLTVHFVLPQGRTLTASVETNCGIEEHKHSPDCYDADGNVVCGKIEHYHTSDCFAQNVADYVDYKCGFDYAHEHSDDCYKNGVLTCSLTEHHHTVRCLFDGSNYGDACDEYITACTRLVKTLDYTSNEEYINLIKSDVDDVAAFINEAYDSNAIYTSEYNDLKAQVTALTNDFNAQVAEQIEASKAPETADNNEDSPVEVVPVKKNDGDTWVDPLENYQGRDAGNVAQAITIKSGRPDGYNPITTGQLQNVDAGWQYHNYELKLWYNNGKFYTDAGCTVQAKYLDYVYEFSNDNPTKANIGGDWPGSVSKNYYDLQKANGNYAYYISYSVHHGCQDNAIGSDARNYIEDCTTIEGLIKRIQDNNRSFLSWSKSTQNINDPKVGNDFPFGINPGRIARVVIVMKSCYTISGTETWGYYNTTEFNAKEAHNNVFDLVIKRDDNFSSTAKRSALVYIAGNSSSSKATLYLGSEVTIDDNYNGNDATGAHCAVYVYNYAYLRSIGGQIINSKATTNNKYGTGVYCRGNGIKNSARGGAFDIWMGTVVKGFANGVFVNGGTARFNYQTTYYSLARHTGLNYGELNAFNYGPYSVASGRTSYCDLSDNTVGIYLNHLNELGTNILDKQQGQSYIMKTYGDSLANMPKCKVKLSSDWESSDVIFGSGYDTVGSYYETPQRSVTYDADGTPHITDPSNKYLRYAIDYAKTPVIGERGNSSSNQNHRVRVSVNDLNGFTFDTGECDTEFVGCNDGPNFGMKDGSFSYGNYISFADDRYPCLRVVNEDANVYVKHADGTGKWYRNLTEAVGFKAGFKRKEDNNNVVDDVGKRTSNLTTNCEIIIFNDTIENSYLKSEINSSGNVLGLGNEYFHGISGGVVFNEDCSVRNADHTDTMRTYYTTSSTSKHNSNSDNYNDYVVKWTINTGYNTDFHLYHLDYCMIVDEQTRVHIGTAHEGSLTFDAGSTTLENTDGTLKKMIIKGVDFATTDDVLAHEEDGAIQNPLMWMRTGAELYLGESSGVTFKRGNVPAEAINPGNPGTDDDKISHDGRAAGIYLDGGDSSKLHLYSKATITECVGFWGGAIYTSGGDTHVTIDAGAKISYITSMRSPICILHGSDITINGGYFAHNYARTGLVSDEFCDNTSSDWDVHGVVTNDGIHTATDGKPFHVYDGTDAEGKPKAKTGGSGRGGCLSVGGLNSKAVINGGLFEYNAADVFGGAIYSSLGEGSGASTGGELTMSNVELRYNFALRGGAVQVDAGARPNNFVTTFTNCYFHDNIAYEVDRDQETYSDDGTAANMRHYIGNSITHITDSDDCAGRGGAIRVADTNTELLLKDCVITDNIAELRGGGICQSYNCKVTLTDTIVAENYCKDVTTAQSRPTGKLFVTEIAAAQTAGTYNIATIGGEIKSGNVGGGICIDDKSTADNHAILTIKGNTNGDSIIGETTITSGFGARTDPYTGNYAYDGGGIHAVSYGQIDFNTGDIYKNVATHDGGGVYAFEHVLINVYSGKATYNEAGRDGGGYSLHNYATLNLSGDSNDATKRAIVDYNRALQDGGGINCRDASFVNIDNGQINNNIAGRYGGGINAVGWNSTHTLVEFTKGTINNNATRTGAVSGGAITGCGGGIYATNYDTTNSTKSSYIVMNPTANESTSDANGAHINNNASVNGAGVFLDDDALMEITGGDISNNEATQDGGGMFINKHATANLTSDVRISVTNNTAVNGAGINVVTDAATSSSAIADCTLNGTSNPLVLQNNAASGNGGAIRIASGGYVESKGKTSRIYIGNTSNRNTAGGDGGGVYITGNSQNILSTFNMKAGQIMYNTAVGDGGGVCIKDYGVMYLSDKDNDSSQHINIHSNTATDGTGIYQDGKLYLNGGPLFYKSDENNQGDSANDIYLAAQVVTTDTAGLTDVIEPNATTATVHVITKNGPISTNINGETVAIPVTLGQMAGAQGGNNFDGRDYVVSLNDKNETNADTTTVIPADLTKFWVKNPTVYDCIYNDSTNSAHQDRIGNDDINDVAVLELDVKQTYSINVNKTVGLDKTKYPSFNPTTVADNTASGATKAFNFTATITNGTFDAVTFGGTHAATPVKTNSTTITFSLKSGENLLIENLAPGSNVTITEDDDSNYNEYSKLDEAFGENEALNTVDRDQTISNLAGSHRVYFKNVPVDKKLMVAKRAGSNSTVQVGTFTFKLKVTDLGGSPVQVPVITSGSDPITTSGLGQPSYNTSTGEMTFTLGFNQQMVFNIPYGYKARVEEVEAPGFSTMVKCNGGGFNEANATVVSIANYYEFATVSANKSAFFYNTASAELPHTIGVNINIFTAAGMSIMLLAVAAAFVVRAYARKH